MCFLRCVSGCVVVLLMGKILHHLRCMKQKTRVPGENYLPSTAVHPCWSKVSIDVSLYVWMICNQGRNKHKVKSSQSDFQKKTEFVPKKIQENRSGNPQKMYVVAFVRGNRIPKITTWEEANSSGFTCWIGLSFGDGLDTNPHRSQVLESTKLPNDNNIVIYRVVVHLICFIVAHNTQPAWSV